MKATPAQTAQLLRSLADLIDRCPDIDRQQMVVALTELLLQGPEAQLTRDELELLVDELGAPRELVAGPTTER